MIAWRRETFVTDEYEDNDKQQMQYFSMTIVLQKKDNNLAYDSLEAGNFCDWLPCPETSALTSVTDNCDDQPDGNISICSNEILLLVIVHNVHFSPSNSLLYMEFVWLTFQSQHQLLWSVLFDFGATKELESSNFMKHSIIDEMGRNLGI